MSDRSDLDGSLTTLTTVTLAALDTATTAWLTALSDAHTQIDVCVGQVAGCGLAADAAERLAALHAMVNGHVASKLCEALPPIAASKPAPPLPTTIADAATNVANAVRGGFNLA